MLPHRIDGLTRSDPGGAARGGVRGVLERVVERCELGGVAPSAVAISQSANQAVLGQQRAVQVGADDGSVRPPRTPSSPERPSLP